MMLHNVTLCVLIVYPGCELILCSIRIIIKRKHLSEILYVNIHTHNEDDVRKFFLEYKKHNYHIVLCSDGFRNHYVDQYTASRSTAVTY